MFNSFNLFFLGRLDPFRNSLIPVGYLLFSIIQLFATSFPDSHSSISSYGQNETQSFSFTPLGDCLGSFGWVHPGTEAHEVLLGSLTNGLRGFAPPPYIDQFFLHRILEWNPRPSICKLDKPICWTTLVAAESLLDWSQLYLPVADAFKVCKWYCFIPGFPGRASRTYLVWFAFLNTLFALDRDRFSN